MRIFFSLTLTLPCLFLLSSCLFGREESINKDHSYDEIEDYKIEWNSLFSLAKTHYFVYFYSVHCGHCEQIKNQIIEYSLTHIEEFFFLEYTSEIPVITNPEQTIGVDNLENFGIRGTPSLVEIENKKVVLNLSGTNDILSFLNLS